MAEHDEEDQRGFDQLDDMQLFFDFNETLETSNGGIMHVDLGQGADTRPEGAFVSSTAHVAEEVANLGLAFRSPEGPSEVHGDGGYVEEEGANLGRASCRPKGPSEVHGDGSIDLVDSTLPCAEFSAGLGINDHQRENILANRNAAIAKKQALLDARAVTDAQRETIRSNRTAAVAKRMARTPAASLTLTDGQRAFIDANRKRALAQKAGTVRMARDKRAAIAKAKAKAVATSLFPFVANSLRVPTSFATCAPVVWNVPQPAPPAASISAEMAEFRAWENGEEPPLAPELDEDTGVSDLEACRLG